MSGDWRPIETWTPEDGAKVLGYWHSKPGSTGHDREGDAMTRDELAALITGRQRGAEITKEESRVAADAGLIVIYGSSGDLVEIDGLVVGEIGAWEGARFAMCRDGLIESECPEGDDCPYFQRAVERGMLFSADYDGTWRFTTECPVSTFEVFDGAELYCVGLVVDVLDLPELPT